MVDFVQNTFIKLYSNNASPLQERMLQSCPTLRCSRMTIQEPKPHVEKQNMTVPTFAVSRVYGVYELQKI